MLKGPLASLERHDRPACEGRSGSERSTEPGSSAKTVASQPVVGYRIRSRTAKKEILGKWTSDTILPGRDGENQLLGKSIADRTQALANLARYQTHMSRNQLRALNMIGKLRADEARYRENVDPKTGAIHRPSVTDPDPYNTPDGPLPTRYEPPAAVAQTPRCPIGFRPNTPSAARSADLGSEVRGLSPQPPPSAPPPLSAPPPGSAVPTGSWSAYEPLHPRHESRNTKHESRLPGPSAPGRVAGTKRTQSRRSYLESMGWSRVPSAAPRHRASSSPGISLIGLRQVGGMPLSETHAPSY